MIGAPLSKAVEQCWVPFYNVPSGKNSLKNTMYDNAKIKQKQLLLQKSLANIRGKYDIQ